MGEPMKSQEYFNEIHRDIDKHPNATCMNLDGKTYMTVAIPNEGIVVMWRFRHLWRKQDSVSPWRKIAEASQAEIEATDSED
jgi:hypothetical protein